MKFFRSYDGTQQTFQIDYGSFHKPFSYLSPEFERLLRSKYVKQPKYNPHIKRLNAIEVCGCTPKVRNY